MSEPPTTGTESTVLTAHTCAEVWSYDGTPCGCPIHPNRIYCTRHRLERADKILDEYSDNLISAEEAKEEWLKVVRNWESE